MIINFLTLYIGVDYTKMNMILVDAGFYEFYLIFFNLQICFLKYYLLLS